MSLQKTFKESYMKTLRDAVKSGVAVSLYAKESFEYDKSNVKQLANVYAPDNLAEKLEEIWEDDFKSAIAIYEAYSYISPLLASNETFWTYLTHVDLFSYVQKRWPEVMSQNCKPDYIIDHWFVGSQGLLRNAIASLWWSVHNTVDESRLNKYELTKVLFANYTMRVITFGSYQLIRHREAMIGILSYLNDNPDIINQTFETRGRFLCKYFNRLGATKQLSYLDRDFFYNTCSALKDKILSIKQKEQINDESLFVEV